MSQVSSQNKKIRLAAVVAKFPILSETFIIDELTGLIDAGVDVEIFAFEEGSAEFVSEKFENYKLRSRTHFMAMPNGKVNRVIHAIPKILRLLRNKPAALFRTLNIKRYGRRVFSLLHIYWSDFFLNFADQEFDLVQCYFGPVGNRFLTVKDLLDLDHKFVTTFYGYDVSRIFTYEGPHVYDRLKAEGTLFFAMSNNMRERLIANGFPADKIIVHPAGIEMDKYPMAERTLNRDELAQIISVGRFVEKKGFDDLLKALAIVKERTCKPFRCTIVGDGPLSAELHRSAEELDLESVLKWVGYMKIEDIVTLFKEMHFFVQPSKTAANGDME